MNNLATIEESPMSKLQFEVEIPSYLFGTPREAKIRSVISRQALEQSVLELYKQREISTGTGAKMLGLPLHDFIQFLGKHQVSIFDFTDEEWQQELEAVNEMAQLLTQEKEAKKE